MKNQILLSSLVALSFTQLIGCHRLTMVSKQSKVEIKFPQVDQSFKIMPPLYQNKSSNEISPLDFSSVTPTGFTGTYPINCFAVFLHGPEAGLRQNTCGRENDSTYTKFPVGLFAGPAASGQSITFDAPSGKDRVVRVIGFHAATATACTSLMTENEESSNLSKPYILGTVGALTFDAGKTVTVNVPMTFDSDKWFDQCEGPLFNDGSSSGGSNGGGGGGVTIATTARLSKDFWPYFGFHQNACSPFYINLTDANGSYATLSADLTYEIQDNGTPINFFPNCNCSGATSTTQTLASGTSGYQCVSFTAPPSNSDHSFTLIKTAGPSEFTNSASTVFKTRSSSTPAFDVVGPNRIAANQCYEYKVVALSWMGSPMSVSTFGFEKSSISELSVYSNSTDCNSNTSPLTEYDNAAVVTTGSSPAVGSIWLKSSLASISVPFKASNTSIPMVGNHPIVVAPSTMGSLAYVKIHSDNNQQTINACPFRRLKIQLFDSNGVAYAPSAPGLNIQISTTGTKTNLYQPGDYNCAGTSANSLSVSVPVGTSVFEVPFKGTATGSEVITVSVPSDATVNGSAFNMTYN